MQVRPSAPSSSVARKDKALAICLRKEGKSYNEIHRRLGVPKSTLSSWFQGLTLSSELQERLYSRIRSCGTHALIARNKRQTVLAKERAERVGADAASKIGALTQRDLLLVGSVLYWAEGYRRGGGTRRGYAVCFSNSDPIAVQVMMRFLREVCQVPEPRFRIGTNLYPGIDVEAARRYWSEISGVPLAQFHKSFVGISSASQRKRPSTRLPYGTCQVRVYDANVFHRVMGWIVGIQQALNGAHPG